MTVPCGSTARMNPGLVAADICWFGGIKVFGEAEPGDFGGSGVGPASFEEPLNTDNSAWPVPVLPNGGLVRQTMVRETLMQKAGVKIGDASLAKALLPHRSCLGLFGM